MVSPVALPGFEELHIVPDRIEVSSELPPYAITDPQRIGEVLNAIDRVPFYAEDVETDSLDWTRGHLHGMSISTHDQDFYVFEQALEPFLAGLVDLHRRSPNKGVIGHNLKFDLHFLSKYGYRPQMISDTMIAQRTADENVERALKTLAYTRLGYENLPEYKDLLKEAAVYYTCTNTRKCGNKTTYRETGSCPFCGKALAKKSRDMREMTIMDIPRGKLVEYAARDTRLTYDLWPLMKSDLQTESLYDFFFKYEMPFLYVLLDIESNGVYINQAVITQMEKDLLEQAEAARNEWRSIAGEVNYNSPIELPDYLFKTLKLPVQGKTPGGKPSTDALTLMRLEKLDKSGAVSSLLKLREVEKLLGTYIEPLQNVDRNGRKHTSLNQDGAATGRLSSSNPNLQNIPSRGDLGKHIREAFVAADDDHVILVADYSQLELRLVAHMSGEPAMIKVFEAGGDPHQDTADRMSIPRKIAKNINFGCVPMYTTALTPFGWSSYQDLAVGDMVMGYNPETKAMEWTKVLNKFYYEDAPIVRMQVNRGFDVRVTPNHRWYSEHRHSPSKTHRYYQGEFVETMDINSEDRIILSAPAYTPKVLDITPNDAAIIAWLHTDGSIKRGTFTGARSQAGGKRVQFEGRILQKKEVGKKHIEELLVGIKHRDYTDKKSGVVHYILDPSYLRGLWKRAHLDEMSLEMFVGLLDPEQRRAFMTAAYLAEGNVRGVAWERGSMHIAQNEGDTLEALRLGAFLEGYYVGSWDRMQYTGNNNVKLNLSRPHITGMRLRITEDGHEAVWCIQTELGTWVMRQGDQIMVTGNSVYGVGPRTLADTIEKTGQPRPSQVDAKRWLQEYDSTYKRLYAWKQEQAALARTQGYVTTLLGRKRRLPEANSFDQSLRNRAERQAFNAPIQGSAADVIQLAMLDVANYTDWYGAKMLLQVHDELVFEVPKSVAEEFGKVVQEKMEGVTQTLGLTVQLKAEPGSGSNWLSAKG